MGDTDVKALITVALYTMVRDIPVTTCSKSMHETIPPKQ
jgi:hypothetical protein